MPLPKQARAVTFKTAAGYCIDAHEAGWRNTKHAAQWRSTLATYVFPVMGDLPVGKVGTAEVLAALEPIWRAKPETASRVRGRIEAILDYGKTREWRSGENPARWRGHLDNLLPTRSKVAKVEHHAALPWQQIAAIISGAALRRGRLNLQFRPLFGPGRLSVPVGQRLTSPPQYGRCPKAG